VLKGDNFHHGGPERAMTDRCTAAIAGQGVVADRYIAKLQQKLEQ
jgi:hypothetical protein